MHVQFPFVFELESALDARPGQTTRVLRCHVANHRSALPERQAAFTTPVGFLASVDSDVPFQSAGLGERETARSTRIRLLARVNSHVLRHVTFALEPRAAYMTEKCTSVVRMNVFPAGFLRPKTHVASCTR